MAISKSQKNTELNEMFILGTFNNSWKQIIKETIKWLGLCFINKECKKHERNKIMYSEICKILFFKKIFHDKIQIEKNKLNTLLNKQS
jgi:hypothetical protein